MKITNVRYGRLVFMVSATILVLFMFLLAQFSLRASGGRGILDRAKQHFHHWFQKTVFKHNWEDIHCHRKHANETTVEKSWIPELAKQLNLKDDTSVFDSNTGCNEWLTLLRKEYPKVVIGGAHTDQYAVDYAKRLFNDTPSTFGTISSDGKLSFLGDKPKFSHVINYGGLRQLGNKEIQCNLVRELLRILHPGGSIYLGHNVEETECKLIDKFSKISLPGCYWSETCLKNRTDVALIYYIKEKDLFGAHAQIDDCYTAVFIHKKVIISRGNDGQEEPDPRHEKHKNMYFCKTEQSGSIVNKLKELAMRTDLVFPGSLSKGIELAKRMHEKIKGNISNIAPS
ncbi:uncharacterized protein LOC111332788 [Stylophora pistillata]|uniref:Methyltransferase domain-containing protein n=1 Tax=Stylophora pistillata TaxID=50429 RepID=A0A2B4S2D5_STYPI|nr:uncharacterized protein LOC111332788 [Stylophora pistillata]PFX23576.1 hypothetical protein AWC38_SpisGene11881 [Stylophora pistillata]